MSEQITLWWFDSWQFELGIFKWGKLELLENYIGYSKIYGYQSYKEI